MIVKQFRENGEIMNYANKQHRYYALDYYLKEKYGQKVFKISLNGNFTCPNRDGTISTKGCIFVAPKAAGFAGDRFEPLENNLQPSKTLGTKVAKRVIHCLFSSQHQYLWTYRKTKGII